MQDHRALLLNADFRPLNTFPLSTIPWQNAIKLDYEGLISVVAEYPEVVRSPSVTRHVPSVVALKTFQHPPRHVPFTRFNVYLRDHFRCQYCGNKFKAEDLTFDHVIPRCDDGPTNWENIVTACWRCNMDKDHHRRQPLVWPRKPTMGELARAQRQFKPGFIHETWLSYLYWTSEIEQD